MRIIEAIFFFTPYLVFKRSGDGLRSFVTLVVLISSNIASVLALYYSINIEKLPDFSNVSSARARTIGILSLVPFGIIFLVMRGLYRKKFSEYLNLSADVYGDLKKTSLTYIILSILFFFGSAIALKSKELDWF